MVVISLHVSFLLKVIQMNRLKKKPGSRFVELLVVIAIIGVLVGLPFARSPGRP